MKKAQKISAELAAELIKMRSMAAKKCFKPVMLYHRETLSDKDFKRIFFNNIFFYDKCWGGILGRSNVRKIRFKINQAQRLCQTNTGLLDELKSKLLKP